MSDIVILSISVLNTKTKYVSLKMPKSSKAFWESDQEQKRTDLYKN